MEDIGTHLMKLLVAKNVQIHRCILQYMQSLPMNEEPTLSPIWRTPAPPSTSGMMGHHLHELHCGTPGVTRLQYHHGGSGLCGQVSPLCPYTRHMWKFHGFPQSIVLDRGLQFVTKFMQELYHLLGITIASSTTYHPQMDGQIE